MYNSYFEKSIKRWSQWFQGKRSWWEIGWCNPTSQKNIPLQFFILFIYLFIYYYFYHYYYCHYYYYYYYYFWSLAHFIRRGIKGNSRWIAQNILSKEVKEVLQKSGKETGVPMELLKKTKCAISEIWLLIFSQYFEWVLS